MDEKEVLAYRVSFDGGKSWTLYERLPEFGMESADVIPLGEIAKQDDKSQASDADSSHEDADNVHVLPVVTTHDIPADRILRAALKAGMSKVVILGYDADDEEYFASSVSDGGTVLWLMERCKKKLIDID